MEVKNKKTTPPASRAAIEKAIEGLRSAIQADGGDVSFVSFRQGVVTVALKGACATCPLSTQTLKLYIEQRLRQEVPGVKKVEQV